MDGGAPQTSWSFKLFFAVVVGAALTSFGAEQPRQPRDSREPLEVEFFSAVQQGKIDVRVAPNSYSSLRLGVANATRSPLRVKLPTTFAAVPVARVRAMQSLRMRGVPASLSGNFGQYGNTQGLGGSLAGPWWGNSVADDGQAYLSLAPGQFVQAQLPCFCLEYGRPDPEERIPYVLCPLTDLNARPALAGLLRQFASRGINQSVVQLAVWHIATDVPWQELSKVRFPWTETSRSHRVTPMELAASRRLAATLKYASLSNQR